MQICVKCFLYDVCLCIFNSKRIIQLSSCLFYIFKRLTVVSFVQLSLAKCSMGIMTCNVLSWICLCNEWHEDISFCFVLDFFRPSCRLENYINICNSFCTIRFITHHFEWFDICFVVITRTDVHFELFKEDLVTLDKLITYYVDMNVPVWSVYLYGKWFLMSTYQPTHIRLVNRPY